MAESWDYYSCLVDDLPSYIFVDLRLEPETPDVQRPWLLRVSLKLQFAAELGESHELEEETLQAIDDRLCDALHFDHDARYVGMMLCDAHREYFFYAPDPTGLEATVEELMLDSPMYEYRTTLIRDRQWKTYSELLFPSDMDLQLIRCRRRMDEMLRRGMHAAELRELKHSLTFPTDAARCRFVKKIREVGLKVQALYELPQEAPELPCKLNLVRSDRFEPRRLEAVVSTLFRSAEECGGDYEGWQPVDDVELQAG